MKMAFNGTISTPNSCSVAFNRTTIFASKDDARVCRHSNRSRYCQMLPVGHASSCVQDGMFEVSDGCGSVELRTLDGTFEE